MKDPKALPLTPDMLRALPAPGIVVVMFTAGMLADWLEGAEFATPNTDKSVTLITVLPTGMLNISGAMVPAVDLVFKETYVVEAKEAEAAGPGGLAVPVRDTEPRPN